MSSIYLLKQKRGVLDNLIVYYLCLKIRYKQGFEDN